MIAISTYTEPVPVSPASEVLPQLHGPEEEKEDSIEQASFAELLANLLRNDEKNQEIPVMEIPEGGINFDAFSSEELITGQKLNLINESVETDFSGKQMTEGLNMLFDGEDGLAGVEVVSVEAGGDLQKEFSNLIRTDLLPQAELDADFFEVVPKDNVASNLHAASAVAAQNEEAVSASLSKKDRSQKSLFNNENTDLVSVKKGQTEEAAKLRARHENEIPGKLDDMRAKARERSSRGKFSVEVRDMRSGAADAINTQNRSFAAVEAAVGRTVADAPTREITLELRIPQQEGVTEAQNQAHASWEAKAASAVENLLARELHNNFNGDIVRHASMALKDGGQGFIKINLKPESLGNVKIALELTDNKITGQIVVESEEALNAFRREIASLEQAFRDSGFTTADLNLSLNSGNRNKEGMEHGNGFMPGMLASRYDDSYENGVANTVNIFIGQKKSSINMLA